MPGTRSAPATPFVPVVPSLPVAPILAPAGQPALCERACDHGSVPTGTAGTVTRSCLVRCPDRDLPLKWIPVGESDVRVAPLHRAAGAGRRACSGAGARGRPFRSGAPRGVGSELTGRVRVVRAGRHRDDSGIARRDVLAGETDDRGPARHDLETAHSRGAAAGAGRSRGTGRGTGGGRRVPSRTGRVRGTGRGPVRRAGTDAGDPTSRAHRAPRAQPGTARSAESRRATAAVRSARTGPAASVGYTPPHAGPSCAGADAPPYDRSGSGPGGVRSGRGGRAGLRGRAALRATRFARGALGSPGLKEPARAQRVRKSAKSNPGETTQLTSVSASGEASARCQVPAGTTACGT